MVRREIPQDVNSVQTKTAALPLLEVVKGKPSVTSLQIAAHFGKEHANVLRDIERILPQVPEIFNKLNFELIEVPVKIGFGIRLDKAYALSRDGFSLLAMGFTGKAALAWKVRYIEAFNAMEKALLSPQPARLLPFPQVKVLPRAQRDQLNELVLAKLTHVPAALAWKARMSIWTAFNRICRPLEVQYV